MHHRNLSARGLLTGIAAIVAASAAAPTASAQDEVATDSAVFVERSLPGNLRALEPADSLSRGDRVVTIVTWRRLGGDGGFTITNPLPKAISYQASAFDNQEVSVDGGRSWGRLGDLRIGNRIATPEDVTHMRWRFESTATARRRGQIVYSGIVR